MPPEKRRQSPFTGSLVEKDLHAGRGEEPAAVTDVDTSGAQPIARQAMACRPAEERRTGDAEVQLGFTEDQVQREAARCLDCGVCSECYQCVDACLAKAVNHDMEASKRQIRVGAIVLAPGFAPFDPSRYETYGYAAHPMW